MPNHLVLALQVLKLDIDTPKLEYALIEQIKADPDLSSYISELVFEMHYDHPGMHGWFGNSNGVEWIAVVKEFNEMRKMGIRVHYWP